jgi:hypothetical protein
MLPFSRFCRKKCSVCLGCKNKQLTKSKSGINCGNDWYTVITYKISVSRIQTYDTSALLIHPQWAKLFWVIFWNWIHASKEIRTSEISRFWSRVVEVFRLLGCYVACIGGWLPTNRLPETTVNKINLRRAKSRKSKDQNTAILYYIQALFNRKIISLYS